MGVWLWRALKDGKVWLWLMGAWVGSVAGVVGVAPARRESSLLWKFDAVLVLRFGFGDVAGPVLSLVGMAVGMEGAGFEEMGVGFGAGLGVEEGVANLGDVTRLALCLVVMLEGVGFGVWLGVMRGRVGFGEAGAGLTGMVGVEMTA